MRMTPEEFERERRYQTATYYVRKMLDAGLITTEEYDRIDTKNREKYKPVTGDLLSRKSLLYLENRANMGAGKEVEQLENGNQG